MWNRFWMENCYCGVHKLHFNFSLWKAAFWPVLMVLLPLLDDSPWCPEPGNGWGVGEGRAGVPAGWGSRPVWRCLQGKFKAQTASEVPGGSLCSVPMRAVRLMVVTGAGEQRTVEEVWRQTNYWHSNLRGEIQTACPTDVFHKSKYPHWWCWTHFSNFLFLVQMGFTGIAVGAAMVSLTCSWWDILNTDFCNIFTWVCLKRHSKHWIITWSRITWDNGLKFKIFIITLEF